MDEQYHIFTCGSGREARIDLVSPSLYRETCSEASIESSDTAASAASGPQARPSVHNKERSAQSEFLFKSRQKSFIVPKKEWSRAQRRAYGRILAGIHNHKGQKLRFLTLTSAPGMKRDIQASWRVLKERIKRTTPNNLCPYFRDEQDRLLFDHFTYFYPKSRSREWIQPLKFEACKIKTSEGVNGVLHVLFYGSFIPQKWLSEQWLDITGAASVVDIRISGKVNRARGLAYYVVSQYCANQSDYLRCDAQDGWLLPFYSRIWKMLNKQFRFYHLSLEHIEKYRDKWHDLVYQWFQSPDYLSRWDNEISDYYHKLYLG